MEATLKQALQEINLALLVPDNFVRLVLSGRRRNMQTPSERIDVKPVLLQ